MAFVQGKAYRPHFGEPWEMLLPDDDHPCYRLADRDGRVRARTPGASEEDARCARRILDAINGVVNFSPEVLSDLAEKWNRNAEGT